MATNLTERIGGLRSSLGIKAPVRVATTTNIVLAGEQVIDGVLVLENGANGRPDRVLVKDQTDASQNGIYNVSTGVFTRSKDFDGQEDVVQGTQIYVHDGAVGVGNYVVLGAADPIIIDVSDITFSSAGSGSALFSTTWDSGSITWDSGTTTWDAGGGQTIRLREFGAVGDGVTDDTAAIQACINAVHAEGGGVVYFPTGTYKVTAQLTLNNSGDIGRFAKRVSFVGDGPASSIISMVGVAGPLFSCVGNATYPEAYIRFEGLQLTGNNFAGSVGLAVDVAAFLYCENIVIEAFETLTYFRDVEQSLFARCNFRWGINGVTFQAANLTSSPNSITFVECCIANNAANGLTAINPNAFVFLGGSIQYNGTVGVAGEYGVNFINPGDGYGTLSFFGTIFEGNGGDYDIQVATTTDPSTLNLFGVAFARSNSTSYATNNVRMTGTAAVQTLNMSGTMFRHFNDYVPSAGRPYLNLANANCKVIDDGSNYFQSATETIAYPDAQLVTLGAKNGAWAVTTPAVTPIGGPGAFAATSVLHTLRTGKLVTVQMVITITNAGTATGFTVPFPVTPSQVTVLSGSATNAVSYNWFSTGQVFKFDATATPVAQSYYLGGTYEAA